MFALLLFAVAGTLGQTPSSEHQDLSFFRNDKGEKRPIRTVADWELRRKQILDGMTQAMGPLPQPDKRVPLDVKQVEETRVGDLIRRKITFQSEPGDRVAAWLFIPTTKIKKFPAVLCLHQTTRIGKDEPAGLGGSPDLHYALHLARRGYITLAPDYPSFGESKWDFDPKKGYQSGTMKAIWDNTRAVDLLESLAEVDKDRIGVIGHSLGGHNAMFTAAFEPRLKVIVSSCGFTRFHRDDMPSWTGKVYMPLIASKYMNSADRMPFDFPEVVAAFAPRPFLACAATKDDDFEVRGVRESLEMASKAYELYGKKDNLKGYYPEAKHSFPEAARQQAYEFLDRHLKP